MSQHVSADTMCAGHSPLSSLVCVKRDRCERHTAFKTIAAADGSFKGSDVRSLLNSGLDVPCMFVVEVDDEE